MNEQQIREQIRILGRLFWSMAGIFAAALLLAGLMCWCMDCCGLTATGGSDTLGVRVDSVRDTVFIEIRDTVPVVRRETVIKRIPVLELLTEARGDSLRDGATDSLPIVQREYSDDSTYTAWVSGVRHGDWPRLDSISVRQREIRRLVTETITVGKRQSRWSVGLQAGYGYGFQYRGLEPYVGVGVTYRLFPP